MKLPKVRLEVAKKGSYIYGGKLYNEVPIDIRRSETLAVSKRRLDTFLK